MRLAAVTRSDQRRQAFINANDSFCYRQLLQQSARNDVSDIRCCHVSSMFERTLFATIKCKPFVFTDSV
jgi:hypothetical protein